MRRISAIIASILSWIAIILYFVMASNLSEKGQRGSIIKSVNVEVEDSAIMSVITPEMVLYWFHVEGIELENSEIARLNTLEIKEFIEKRAFVKSASVYVDMTGVLNIEIEQRKPIARFHIDSGHKFYITEDNYILPLQKHEVVYVPIVTGSFTLPFSRNFVGQWRTEIDGDEKKECKNYKFFDKLITFVVTIRERDFWNSHIVQVNVLDQGFVDGITLLKEPEIELVPRVGKHVVRLGRLHNEAAKLEKLMMFYKSRAGNTLWNSRTYINLEYDGQVVCTPL